MSNTITAYFKGRVGVAESVYQNDYGIVMVFDSIDLPAHFDCYFSVPGSDTSTAAVGADNRVVIPNSVLGNSGSMAVHIPLHTGENDSEVEYVVYFKVIGRARPEDDGTPTQMTAIEQALALLQNPITNIEQIVNEALAFTGETFEEMKQDLQDDFDNYTDTLEGDLATWKGGVESDFDNLEAQFDTAVAAVTTDTEVTNIRVGDDNVIYTTAGEAVRTQFANVKSALNIGMGEPYNYVYTTKKPNNLINKYSLISGAYIDASGGVAYASGWNRTDYIDISDYTHITMTGGIGNSAFYDSSKQFISTVSSQQIGYAVPSGAVYMRCSVSDANLPTALLNGGSVQLAYDDGCFVIPFPKKEYQAGWIEFTVPVNQTIVKFNSTTSDRDDSQDYVNVECVLKLPNTYTPNGVPTKLVMLCHGAGRGVTFPNPSDNKAWIELDAYNTMVNYFVTNGYAVFDCNGYDNTWLGVNFWGAPKGIEAWRKAYDYVTDNYNVETSFSLFGFSMGGLTACSLMMNGFPNIKCAVLASPVLDLQKCWEDGQTAFMEAGYGMSGSYNPDIVGGSDPMAHLLTIDNVKYCLPKMPPIKIWYGSTETGIAVNKAYAQTLVNAIQASGGFAVYREVSGAGHEICYGGNNNCNLEYYLWINRFNDNYYN